MKDVCFVAIGVESDYMSVTKECGCKSMENYYWFMRPEFRLKGLTRFLFKLHNSEKINRIISLPFKSIWAKTIITKDAVREIKERYKRVIFLFNATGYRYKKMGVFNYLKKTFPSCKLVYRFADKVDLYLKDSFYYDFRLKDLEDNFDCISTFNKQDSLKYGFLYTKPCLNDLSSLASEEIKYDVFFVGKNKGRLDRIHSFYKKCMDKGLVCDFYITDVPIDKQLYANKIHYNQHIPYEVVVKKASSSKAILNIVQEGVSGFTRRDYEAIGLNKILITNNDSILTSPFYTSDKVIMIGNFENECFKIDRFDQNQKWNGVEGFSVDLWFDQYEKDINDYCLKKNSI